MSEEIEKMYKNCNLLKPQGWSCKLDRIKFSGVCCELIKKGLHCSNCEYSKQEYYYPPFTDDKQLKLIRWFIRNESDIEIIFNWDEKIYYFKTYEVATIDCRSFKEALANLINIHFEDFTDEEKEEIRKILE